MSDQARQPRYSTLGNLRNRLGEMADRNIRTLSVADLKSVVIWLEAHQFDNQVMVSMEDDAVMNAKLRGKAEFIDDLCEELMTLAAQVASEAETPTEEEA